MTAVTTDVLLSLVTPALCIYAASWGLCNISMPAGHPLQSSVVRILMLLLLLLLLLLVPVLAG
jgi:hypothetical protein